MTVLSPGWTPSPDALRRGGHALLWTGLVLGIAGLVAGVWFAPEWLPLAPAVLVGLGAAAFLLPRPQLHLYVVLLGSALILEHQPGVQITEVLYGLYALFFLVAWLLRDAFGGAHALRPAESRLLLLFLALTVALVPVAFAYGATAHTVVREMISLAMLLFFFPVRETIARDRRAVPVLLVIALVLGLFVVVRNVSMYVAALNSAEQLGEMIIGRVIANDAILAAASLFAFVFLIHAQSLRQAVGYAVAFMMFFAGLLLTMSRGFWVAFFFGLLVVFVAVDARKRARMVLYSSLAAASLLLVGAVFFGNLVDLFLGYVVERLFSVQGSLTQDISMLGRVYEARAALEHIALNPVLGHGAGVPFTYTTIVSRTEATTTFIHNGYVYLVYAFGVVGAGLMLVLWGRAIWSGWATYRSLSAPLLFRLGGLAAAASLSAFTLSALTSNPFWHKDLLLMMAFLFGLAFGLRAQTRRPQPPTVPCS